MKSLCTVAMVAVCTAWASGAKAQTYSYSNAPRFASAEGNLPQPSVLSPSKISAQARAANPPAPDTDLSQATQSNWDGTPAAGGSGCGGSGCGNSGCGMPDCGMGCCCPNWYVSAKGLVMTRDVPNTFVTTFETGVNTNQLQGTGDANAGWGGGFEVVLGYNCCCENAFEVSYFGLWGMKGEADRYSSTNSLSTPMINGNVYLPDAAHAAGGYFDNAREHKITREDEAHDVELNYIYHALANQGNCNGLNVDILAGVRYFRFTEQLEFASLAGASAAGNHIGNDPANTAYLDVNTENNMVGFQLGSKIDWRVWNNFSLFATPKFGIYGNHMTSHSNLHRGDGAEGVFTDTGDTFDLHGAKTSVSFLASMDLGLNYDITSNWSIFGGYRVLAVTGVALSDNQMYPYLAGESDYQNVKSNGSLILHGVFAGTEFRW
ncbi:MAG TPA: BBP7 family outer membrane beta-barrel protein [Pirellulales bacterium]|nr:BBP7 family outer membrane beta-barrel protein [Pirellulales bacterium]